MSPVNKQPWSWTDDNFDSMTWHDCTIHAMGLDQDGPNQSDFVIDLDFVIEWLPASDGAFQFRVAPALLRFHAVDRLVIHTLLDYKQAMQISEIRRCRCDDPDVYNYHWTIKLHSYVGRENDIEFDSPAFSQRLTAQPIVTSRQSLYLAERLRMKGELE